MSTPLRDESPGYHHVVTRGNNKRSIYLDDHDREFFCWTVIRIAKKYGWTVLAYCLMDNHYHLLISVGEKGLAGGMCELNSGYATHVQRPTRPREPPVRQAVLEPTDQD